MGSPTLEVTQCRNGWIVPRALRALRSVASFDLGYLRKWLVISGLIGIVAGLSAILFIEAIDFATSIFIGHGVGYTMPSPAGSFSSR